MQAVQLAHDRAHRRIGLMWRASFPKSEDLEEFGRFIRDQLPDSVEPIAPAPSIPARVTPSPSPCA